MSLLLLGRDLWYLSSSITKQIDVDWAEGDGDGGFPSGLTIANDTWYHVFVIAKADGTTDAGFDTSLTAANLLADATGYTKSRRVGSVKTDGSANIVGFSVTEISGGGMYYTWNTPPADIVVANLGAAAVLYTISTPLGIRCLAETFNWLIATPTGAVVLASCPDADDVSPNLSVGGATTNLAGSNAFAKAGLELMTNTLSQIRARSNVASTNLRVLTRGFTDFRR